MYRIELSPGEETVFRTVEELATGVRNGLVTPRARIYHNASQKWLPIEFHPHYKKALELLPRRSGERPVISGERPAIAEMPTPALVHVPIPAIASPVSALPTIAYPDAPAEEAPPHVVHTPLDRLRRTERRPFYFAAAAAVLIIGTYLAVSAAMTGPSREKSAPATSQALPLVPETTASVASVVSVADSSVQKASAVPRTSSGPTFGPPTPAPRPPAKRTAVSSIGASRPAPAVTDSAQAVEPPPAELDLSLPALPRGDSLAPTTPTDSGAMRRILRTVSGKGEASPAPQR